MLFRSSSSHPRAFFIAWIVSLAASVSLAFAAWRATPIWFELHSHSFRCVRDLHTLQAGHFFRWMLILASVLLIALAVPMTNRVGRLGWSWAAFGRYLVAIASALFVAEIVLRAPWKPPPPPPPPSVLCPPLVFDRPGRHDFEPRSACTQMSDGREISYFVDDENDRVASAQTVHDHAASTILVGGESIAAGVGVPYEESFASSLERDLRVQVIDSGVYGYSFPQAYEKEVSVAERYAHVDAIVTIFIAEEVMRQEDDSHSRWRADARGGLSLEPARPEWMRDIRLFGIASALHHGEAVLDDMRATARAIADLARRHGAFALFVTTNFNDRCLKVEGRDPALFRTVFDDQGLTRIHVDLPPDELIVETRHPNARGHARLEKAIALALANAGIGAPSK